MRTGVRDLITTPFDRDKVVQLLHRIRLQVEKQPPVFPETSDVFAFLSAQGGSGSSLVAANTAIALSETHKRKSLLVDCDIISGMSSLFFRGDALYTLLDVAAEAHELDGDRWREMVLRHNDLDLIVAGRSTPDRHLEASHMRHLVSYARRSYATICLDVPNLTKVMLETLSAASRIFIVCTPELNSLFMAREKHRFLADKELGGKVEFILNRFHRKAQFTKTDCEEVLEQSLYAALPNDYESVQRAIRAGAPIDAGSQLGKAVRELAARSVAKADPAAETPSRSRRFLEHFYVMPTAKAG